MSDLFSLFNPGHAHLQRQKDLEKVLIVDAKQGGTGPQPLDLGSGSVTIQLPAAPSPEPVAPVPGPSPGRDTQTCSSNDDLFAASERQNVVRAEPAPDAKP